MYETIIPYLLLWYAQMISISIVHHVFSFTMRFFVITTFNLNLYPHLFKLKGVTKNFHSEEKNPEDACGRKKKSFLFSN